MLENWILIAGTCLKDRFSLPKQIPDEDILAA